MTLSDIKNYLNARPFTPTLPSDEELTKYMNFSITITKLFYGIDDSWLDTNDYAVTVIGEEIVYLLQNNPTIDIYAEYNYLKSFTVAGAIRAEVVDKAIGFLAPMVKLLMKALDIELLQGDTGKSYYTYGIF